MEKKNINWGELGFSYQQTEKRFVANFKDGAQKSGFFLFISPHFFTFSYRNILQRKSVKKNENYIEASY